MGNEQLTPLFPTLDPLFLYDPRSIAIYWYALGLELDVGDLQTAILKAQPFTIKNPDEWVGVEQALRGWVWANRARNNPLLERQLIWQSFWEERSQSQTVKLTQALPKVSGNENITLKAIMHQEALRRGFDQDYPRTPQNWLHFSGYTPVKPEQLKRLEADRYYSVIEAARCITGHPAMLRATLYAMAARSNFNPLGEEEILDPFMPRWLGSTWYGARPVTEIYQLREGRT